MSGGLTLSALPTCTPSCVSASPTVAAAMVFVVVLPSALTVTALGVTTLRVRPWRPMVSRTRDGQARTLTAETEREERPVDRGLGGAQLTGLAVHRERQQPGVLDGDRLTVADGGVRGRERRRRRA